MIANIFDNPNDLPPWCFFTHGDTGFDAFTDWIFIREIIIYEGFINDGNVLRFIGIVFGKIASAHHLYFRGGEIIETGDPELGLWYFALRIDATFKINTGAE